MFWSKKSTESEDFQTLFKKFENLRIEVESVKLELQLYKVKFRKKAGIIEEEEEKKEKKDPYNNVLVPIKDE